MKDCSFDVRRRTAYPGMKRLLSIAGIVLVALAACAGLIAVLASRDSSQVGGTSGPGTLEADRGSGSPSGDAPQTPASAPDDPPTSGRHPAAPVRRDQSALSDDELLTAL